MSQIFALKGTIVHTPDMDAFEVCENSYVLCEKGITIGIF